MQTRPLRSYSLFGRLVLGYEDRLTNRGRFLLWATAAFALVGLDTNRSQAYVLFAAAFAVLLSALLMTQFRRARARLECVLPARATALRPVPIRARVTALHGQASDLRLAFPRPIRWGASVPVEPRELFLSAGKGTPTEATVVMRPLRRGRYELRGPTLRAMDPLRICAGPALRLPQQTLLVYPRFYRLDEFPLPLGRRYQLGGIPLSSSTGDAIEFVGTRDYRDGDPVKNIHWRSWARRGQPVVKEYQEEYFCRIALILDTFLPKRPSPRDHAAFEAALSIVASIADHFSRSEYIVDILAAGPDVYEVSAGRSLGYLDNILDVLACLEPCREAPFATIGPALFERLAQTSTVVAILQDWDETRERFLRQVEGLGTAVRAIVVREGEMSRPFGRALDEIGTLTRATPAQVEAALAAEEAAREGALG